MNCSECGKPLGSVAEWVYIGGHKAGAHWTCVYRLWAINAPAKVNTEKPRYR